MSLADDWDGAPEQLKTGRPRILYVLMNAPRPVSSGYAQRVDAIAQALAACSSLRLLVLMPRPSAEAEAETARHYDAAFLSPPPGGKLQAGLRQLRAVVTGRDRWLNKYFSHRDFAGVSRDVASFAPDVVIAGYPNLQRITRAFGQPLSRTIIDHPDPASINFSRRADAARGLLRVQLRQDARYLRRVERECAGALDHWCVSENDRPMIEQLVGDPAYVVPNVVDERYFEVEAFGPRSSASTPEIGFVGAFGYEPNEAAALSFMDISEALEAAGTAHRGWLVGNNPTARMHARAAGLPNVTVTGFVADLEPLLSRFTVMLAPIWAGSGTKLKILQSMAMGVPVVTTPVGAEGIPILAERLGLVGETQAELIAACRRLIASEGLRRELAGRARDWARRHASQSVLEDRVAQRLRALASPGRVSVSGDKTRSGRVGARSSVG